MNVLGFKYKPLKKCYYVDSHEAPENVRYRKAFITRYFKYEIRCHRWHSITAIEKAQMVKEGKLDEKLGYNHVLNGIDMVEYHVDDHVEFQTACNNLPYGGNLSVRKPPHLKPLFILGQDECIFKQYLFNKGLWMSPDGKKQLIPKDEGQGLMLSSFCCHELGYGFTLSKEELDKVNKNRIGKKYSDETTAKLKNGTPFKSKLTESPFVRQLEYGANNDGYWTYEHMVLQLEDCIDVLSCLFPSFDFLFLLDHSNGHDRMKPDGLNINRLNVRHGGKQPKMRNSKLTIDNFGPFHTPSYNLQPGMIQSMQFSSTDVGPCYYTEEERNKYRLDINTGKTREKDLNKSELITNLKNYGILEPSGSKSKLKEQTQKLKLPTHKQVPIIQEGWVDKPKGSLQILYERGWIDPNRIEMYTLDGKVPNNNEKHHHTTELSICSLTKLQSDFLQEVTLLQYHAQKLGTFVDRTPKCHPELAGEGIEYAWAIAKLFYRKAPIKKKRNKKFFHQLVEESTNPKSVLSCQRLRSCAKKARSYMKMYNVIENLKENENLQPVQYSILEGSMKLYSKMKKTGKTHRNIADKNKKDVNEVLDESNVIGNGNKKIIKEETIELIVHNMHCI